MSNIYSSIPSNKRVYLDHAGATLPSPQLMQDIAAWLTDPSLCLANPHSRHASGQFTSNAIEDIRQRILQHFHVSHTEYALVFTANATAALKLLAESYSFGCSTGKRTRGFC